MPAFLSVLLFAMLLSSCATFPDQEPHDSRTSPTTPEAASSRALYLYSRARLASLDGDYPAALTILRNAIELDPSSAFLYAAVAEVKLKIGQIPEAMESVKNAIKLDPAYRAPYLLAGTVMASSGRDQEAAGYLRTAVKLDPSKDDAYLQLAVSLTRLFEYEEAVSTLKALVKVNSDSVLGYYYLGKTYGQMKLYRDAAGYFSKTLELRPDFDQAAIDLAATYEAMGDYAQAIETYKGLVDGEDEKTAVLQRLIQLLIQQRRFPDALEYLGQAADTGLGGQETLRKIGLIHLELEQYDEAIRTFSDMLAKDPDIHQIRLYLGMAYEEKGDFDRALAEFAKIPRDSSLYVEAIGHIAFILKEKGNPEQAVSTLKAALTENPRNLELYMNLSSLYEALEKHEDGLALLFEAEKLFPDESRLQFRIGVLFDKRGKRSESIERMKKVIVLNPKDAQALNFLGYTYAEMGINLDEALGYLKQAVKIRPNDGFILDSLGWAYFKLKKYDESLKYMEEALALVSDDATISEHLGDVYAARKEFRKALKMYKKSVDLEPDRKEMVEKYRRFKVEHTEK
jgi:tetratricopeptide (TPR) repeat protein